MTCGFITGDQWRIKSLTNVKYFSPSVISHNKLAMNCDELRCMKATPYMRISVVHILNVRNHTTLIRRLMNKTLIRYEANRWLYSVSYIITW